MNENANPYASPVSEDAAGQVWVRNEAVQLKSVYTGLSLSYWGVILALVGVVVVVVIAAALLRTPVAIIGAFVGLAAGGLVLVGAVLSLVGLFFCLAVPVQSGAKGCVIAAIVLQLVNFVVTPIGVIIRPLMQGIVRSLSVLDLWIDALLGVGTMVAVLGGMFAFVLFIQRLARFMGHQQLVTRAQRVLGGAGFVLITWVGIRLLSLKPGFSAGGFGLLATIAAIVVVVMYANLINGLRKQLKVGMKPEQPPAVSSPKE